ncbi:DUF502 domain-containing protein [Agrobacterium vitis]|uniref:DUF502 domain-containing protein n=1 Tax=Agrobacterium vitis TaxID=373 RepID=A0AAE2RG48_AGRVI|nr:DUF502 domain-containing protein [Agrobacterium vitis]MBF2716115.1 DUF502 domain-containing protein [Agrobacterium vitis]MUZ64725.1 DUF502 domain-containing protein [Agrobacterium vitis]MVA20806.1 DUF502 domain-containing protein [Agrobacterium vitis]
MSDKPERISFASRLRTNFLTGMIICAPLAITVWLTFTFIDWADSWVTPYIPQRYNPEYYFNIAIPGTGLVIAVVGITMIGFLGRNLVGRSIVNFGESILNRMPLVRTLYKSLKQIFETVLKEQSSSFKKVGLIEFPAPGTWAMVFVATEVTGEIAARLNEEGEEMIAVFMPPTPVPTAGFLMFVPRSRLKLLDMTPEEGAKLLISGGLVMPEWKPASGAIAMPPVVDVAKGKTGL